MTEYTADRHRLHAARVKGLYDMAGWMESRLIAPIPEHLTSVATVRSVAVLTDVAIGLDLPGPHRSDDGSYYLRQSFAGDVSWLAAAYNTPGGLSRDELFVRAWAEHHGYVLTPLTAAIPGGETP